ncbi:MAG: glycoside hydrolase family 97 protein [Bacteroidaceae bacterium]|nr:glycoside hydrolase family 97 protein [Bacteroidaceae bacterium]
MSGKVFGAAAAALVIVTAVYAAPRKDTQFTLTDPQGKNTVCISVGKEITYSVKHSVAGGLQMPVINPSRIGLELEGGVVLGKDAHVAGKSTKTVDAVLKPVIYKKQKIADQYSELTLRLKAPAGCKGSYSMVWRAYPDGIAYRITTDFPQDFRVKSETTEFVPAGADIQMVAAPIKGRTIEGQENQWHSNFQNTYKHLSLNQWPADRQIMLPALVQTQGCNLCITEADLLNYPGMRLMAQGNKLVGTFAAYPKDVAVTTRGLKGEVRSREDYIAQLPGKTELPWRVILIADEEKDLLSSDLVYKLAKPADTATDWSWVKPGKVAWDWWNDWNIYGVDFKAGINTETYKYYIDFASSQGIEYVILDEGWAVPGEADLFKIVPEIDLEDLIQYANKRNVGLILWAGYRAFDKDMERVCAHYSRMGIKGFKVDFMDRDDQQMVDFNRRCAEVGAKYKLLIDLHGMYKPTGQQRTWPNAINFEGVYGLEEVKWEEPDFDMVTYDVTYPFIRQVAGPADYTQGAMRNATKENYYSSNTEPMSQGTRCRQLAEYIIFDAPLSMLCDNPSNYLREPECTRFIATVPTVWAETRALSGKIGEYIIMARKAFDGTWYVGGLTNWDARDMDIDLSSLVNGQYTAELFCDGMNADRAARDFKHITKQVNASDRFTVHLAPGGGFVMKLSK